MQLSRRIFLTGEKILSNYIEKNLQADEEVICKAKLNPLSLIAVILLAIILLVTSFVMFSMAGFAGIPTLVCAVALLVIGISRYCSTVICVTNKRILKKTGVIGLNVSELHLDKIDVVGIRMGWLGRLFRYATIYVMGCSGKRVLRNRGISNSNEFKNAINSAIEGHADKAKKEQAKEISSLNESR